MNKLVFCVIITSLIFGCSLQKGRLAREVNPFVGTGFHGHTYPGATVPFGAVQLSPDTRKNRLGRLRRLSLQRFAYLRFFAYASQRNRMYRFRRYPRLSGK